MAGRTKVIIDTDPGCDDVLAILLAFASKPEELEVLLVSLTFGNIDVQNCLRNVVSLFSIVEKEQAWRKSRGKPEGFECLKAYPPVVALGAEKPLADQMIMADFFHGRDGLGDIHTSHPHLTPSTAWRHLFDLEPDPRDADKAEAPSTAEPVVPAEVQKTADQHTSFTPSTAPSHKLILKLLAEHPPDTITIVVLGPMTNLAVAASEDPETFLRAKEVVVMGGAIHEPGNITPLAEFNTHADTVAFARMLALTSKHPPSTMPPSAGLPPYPAGLSRQLRLVLAPLDITTPHVLSRAAFEAKTAALGNADSPVAEWMHAFLLAAWAKTSAAGGLALHDPLALFYALDAPRDGARWRVVRGEDTRVETTGQWTRGACVVDRRDRAKTEGLGDVDSTVSGDLGGWFDSRKGNAVSRIVGSPFWDEARDKGRTDGLFGDLLLDTVFGA